MFYFPILLTTAFITCLSIIAVKKIFPLLGLVDKPEKYGHKRKAVPYPAGVIIPLIFFGIAFFIIDKNSGLYVPMCGFAIASLILTAVSYVDDRVGLSPYLRLGVQALVALIIIASGIGIEEVRSPLGGILSLSYGAFDFYGNTIYPIADGLAFVWIIAMMNSMNWLDGVSGLTSSVSTIASIILAISAYIFGQHDVALLFLVLSTICFVFFIFDLEPLQILMGDSGSMFLGLALAVFTIIAGGKVAIAMIVMFAPLFDAVWTIGRRLINKQSPFKGDYGHLHHKLLKRIPSRRSVVLWYSLIVALFGFTALYFETLGKMLIILILVVLLVLLELNLTKIKS